MKKFSPKAQQVILSAIKERLIIQDYFATVPGLEIIKVGKVEDKDIFDIIIQHNGIKYLTEVKIRTTASDRYDGSLIERHKYNSLINYCMAYGEANDDIMHPLFVSVHTDGKLAFFHLDEIQIEDDEWQKHTGKKYEVFTTGNPTAYTHYNFSIPFTQARIIDFDIQQPKYRMENIISIAKFLFPGNEFIKNMMAE